MPPASVCLRVVAAQRAPAAATQRAGTSCRPLILAFQSSRRAPVPRQPLVAANSTRPNSNKEQQTAPQHGSPVASEQQPCSSSSSRDSGGADDSGSGGSPLRQWPTAVACAAAAVAAVPLVLPHAAAASSVLATLVPHSLQRHQAWETLYWGCIAVGAASTLVTLVCTTRFLVSFYPHLEREAEQRRWRLPWVAVTLFDPLLQPMRRRFFGQTEAGDLDYAALALLATVCSLLECLVGKDGLLNDSIPDFALLHALQYLIVFQHGMLLPSWVLVVLRWGRVL